jgi:hypothetical protein
MPSQWTRTRSGENWRLRGSPNRIGEPAGHPRLDARWQADGLQGPVGFCECGGWSLSGRRLAVRTQESYECPSMPEMASSP